VEAAKDVAHQLLAEAVELPDPDRRKASVTKALAVQSAARIRAMVEMARTEPGVPVDPDELDRDPLLLNVRNGIVDLRTGRLLKHQPRRLLTKLADVDYDPEAEAPRWRAFIERILPDPEVQEFIQRFAGYALTGRVVEQIILFALGIGANGKTTLLDTLRHIMGDYAGQAAPDLLMRRREDPHPTGLADLHGQRLVLATETAQGRHLDEALVKRLTGGDRIKARLMHKDFFEFDPTHKIVVATNHRPGVDGTDHGIWRRIRLVPFDVVIPDDQQDKHLDAKLRAEAPGILRWAIDGARRWQESGLTEPAAVRAATADYRAEQDVIGDFITETCILLPGISTPFKDLYDAYQRWAEATGERPITKKRLGLSLSERGLTKYTSNGTRWTGIGLKTEETE